MPFPKDIYFHEDDYCQIEILPYSLWDDCIGEMKKIDEFSKAHQTESGWTDIYVRKEPPKALSDLVISKDVFKENVEKTLFPFAKVLTGYSSHVENCPNTLAWGTGERNFTIFANFTPKNIISVIWLDLGPLYENNFPVVLETFNNFPNKDELMLADWNWSKTAYLGDEKSIQNYLDLYDDD